MGLTLAYLSLLVLLPFAGLLLKVSGMTWNEYWHIVTSPRVLTAFRLTFGMSLCAALINAFFGFIVAWVLVRYRFPMRRLVDAMVDLPFAMPTAVSGVALLALFKRLGQALDFKIIFTEWGLLLALTFIGLPFVVRTLQPAIQDIETELEEVSASLGATRWQTFWRVIFPSLRSALITGFAMAFARALGEYGSVVFIAGTSIPVVSIEIVKNLQGGQEDLMCAVAIAATMLAASFIILLCINFLQLWMHQKQVD